MSKIKTSTAIDRVYEERAETANVISKPGLLKGETFQIEGEHIIQFDDGRKDLNLGLMSDRNIVFPFNTIMGAACDDKKYVEVLTGKSLTKLKADIKDGKDPDIDLAKMNFTVDKVSQAADFKGRDVYTKESYKGYMEIIDKLNDNLGENDTKVDRLYFAEVDDAPASSRVATTAEREYIRSSELVKEPQPIYKLEVSHNVKKAVTRK